MFSAKRQEKHNTVNMARFLSCLAVLLIFCCCFQTTSLPAMAAEPAPEALKSAVREVLRENPEFILDILKNNSETVLEIAQQGNILRKRKAMLAQWEQDTKESKNIDLNERPFRGNKDAAVTITAYSDFTCPYCRQAEFTLRQLMKKYGDRVRMTFKALPKDEPFSQALAKYSTAAFIIDETKGWEFFDVLFNNVERFEREGEAFLKEAGTNLGYDFRKLKAEAGSSKVQARLDKDRKEADRLGISGTPYFLDNDLLVRGAVSKDLFEEAIEMALKLEQGKS